MSQLDQAPKPQMPQPAAQGDAASMDNNGVALFVSPGQDLAAKPGSDQDSWFLISNLTSGRGTLNLLVHFLHVAPPGGAPDLVAAMVSLLDPQTRKYVAEEQDFPGTMCSLSAEKLEVVTPIGSVTGDASAMRFAGTWATADVAVDLTVSQAGPALANLGTGLFPALGDINFHYAFPTMTTAGTVTVGGEQYDVTGPSWVDRQWGVTPRFFDPAPKKWVWFGISLDNGDRISVWDMAESGRRHAFATVLHPGGGHELVDVEPLVELASRQWTSTDTGRVYPTAWDLRIPQLDARLSIQPDVIEQEFVSPAGMHKYEGASSITGQIRGEQVSGWVVIELVGDWT